MKDTPEKTKEIPAAVQETKHTPQLIRAAQGITPAKDSKMAAEMPDYDMHIHASEMKPETSRALRDKGLDDPQVILANGDNAEAATQTILKHEGLPDGSGGRQPFKDVVPGQFDKNNHGIDLVGITPDGRPYPIEVKKRSDPAQDSMGDDKIGTLLPETESLRKDILHEREVNPALYQRYEAKPRGLPDPELSTRQMGGLWTRDRWLHLVLDQEQNQRLQEAGVDPQYLDLKNLENPDSSQWKEILDNRTTVVVSAGKDHASPRLSQEATLQRGFDVCVINLDA